MISFTDWICNKCESGLSALTVGQFAELVRAAGIAKLVYSIRDYYNWDLPVSPKDEVDELRNVVANEFQQMFELANYDLDFLEDELATWSVRLRAEYRGSALHVELLDTQLYDDCDEWLAFDVAAT